jgi:hypothetical protein
MSPRLLSLLLFGLGCAVASAQQAPARLVLRQGDAASAWFVEGQDPQALSLADEVTVRLRVEGPAPLDVQPLSEPKRTDSWELKEKGKPGLSDTQGKAVWVWELMLTPLQPGEHAVELPPLRYRAGKDELREVKWEPLHVRVATRIKKVEPGSAEGITGPEELPTERPRAWWPWAAAGGGVLLLAALGFVLGRKRSRRTPPLPPDQWALRELTRLGEREPASAEEVERWHTALSAILRRYLEAQFRLPAERRTTPEFLEAARRCEELTADQQALLGEVLARCDLAKFARVQPPAEECRAALTAARRFVEGTAPREEAKAPGASVRAP